MSKHCTIKKCCARVRLALHRISKVRRSSVNLLGLLNVVTKVVTGCPRQQKIPYASLAAWAILLSPFLLFLTKKVTFLLNSYLDLHHSQGGMKFATQLSHLLKFFISFFILSKLILCSKVKKINVGPEIHPAHSFLST